MKCKEEKCKAFKERHVTYNKMFVECKKQTTEKRKKKEEG